MKVRLESSESTEVQMGPLIDCVFLLLIFFIVIAVTKKSIEELGIQLPPPGAAVSRETPRDRDLLIQIQQDGQVRMNQQPVGQQGMLERIRTQREQFPDYRVRFEIDERVAFVHVYHVMDQLQHYGLTDWSIRVMTE